MSNEFGAAATKKEPMLPAWFKVLLGIVGVVVFILLVGWFVLDVSSSAELEAALAQIQALGWPTELADLYPQPIPDSENAAPLHQQASAAVGDSNPISRVDSLESWLDLSEEEQTKVRSHLTEKAEALELLHQAAQVPGSDFNLNYRASYAMPLPHLSGLRQSARLQRAAVIVALADGRTEEALEHWLDSTAVVRHGENQKILISELVRLACLFVSLDALEALVQSGQLTPAHVDRALGALEGIEGHDSFTEGMKGELAFGRDIHRIGPSQMQSIVRPGGRYPMGLGPLVALYRSPLVRPWRQHDEATHIAVLTQLIQLSQQPYYQAQKGLQQWEDTLDDLPPWQAPLTKMLLPALGRACEALARAEARLACARVALALERYRLTHGDYPATLDSLVPGHLPDVPVDPFDGKPVRYVNEGQRVVVYSVGEDLRDDGGSDDTGASRQPLDIVFTVRAAQRQAGEQKVQQ